MIGSGGESLKTIQREPARQDKREPHDAHLKNLTQHKRKHKRQDKREPRNAHSKSLTTRERASQCKALQHSTHDATPYNTSHTILQQWKIPQCKALQRNTHNTTKSEPHNTKAYSTCNPTIHVPKGQLKMEGALRYGTSKEPHNAQAMLIHSRKVVKQMKKIATCETNERNSNL